MMNKIMKMLVMMAAIVGLSGTGYAASRSWQNTSTDFSDPSNWTNSILPTTSDTASFANTQITQPTLSASATVAVVLFGGNSVDYNISGVAGSTLTMDKVQNSTSSGLNTISADILLNNDLAITNANSGTGVIVLSGNITESAPGKAVNITSSGALTAVLLSGNNTFSGGVSLAGNMLKIGSANALGTGTLTMSPKSLTVENAAGRNLVLNNDLKSIYSKDDQNTFYFTGNGYNTTIRDFHTNGASTTYFTITGGSLTVNNLVTTGTGVSKAVNVNGNGTLIINGVSDASNHTVGNGATLVVNGLANNVVTIANNAVATLGGTGVLAGGLDADGTGVALTLSFDIDSAGWDGLDLTGGTFTKRTAGVIDISLSAAAGISGTFDLLDWSTLGTLPAVTDAWFDYSGIPANITVAVIDNKLVATVIPEPSAWLLLGIGVSLLAALRRGTKAKRPSGYRK